MRVLGIETSCDETAVAVVEGATGTAPVGRILSNTVYSQLTEHRRFGGVVPEIASRSHVEKISGVVREAMCRAFAPGGGGAEIDPSWWDRIDAVAVTYGPGLASSLIV